MSWRVPLDVQELAADLESERIESALQADFATRRAMGVRTFPSLVVEDGVGFRVIARGFTGAETNLAALED